jgi:hypothetical protein
MQYIKAAALIAVIFGLFSLSGATLGHSATAAPAVVATQRYTIDVSKPMPATLNVNVGDEIYVTTQNNAPGAPAILGVACSGIAPSNALQELKANNHIFHLFRANQAGTCPLLIIYSHYPPDPKFTKNHTVVITVR